MILSDRRKAEWQKDLAAQKEMRKQWDLIPDLSKNAKQAISICMLMADITDSLYCQMKQKYCELLKNVQNYFYLFLKFTVFFGV